MSIDPNRIIQIEGDGFLPPCFEPQIPKDIKENERVRVFPPRPPWRPTTSDDIILVMQGKSPQDQRYWYFSEAFERKIPSHEWEGDPRHTTGKKLYGIGLGLEPVANGTVLTFDTSETHVHFPDLWEGHGLLIMSGRLLEQFIADDPSAVAYRTAVFRNAKGDTLRSDYHLVDIVRNVPAIDIANSIIDYKGPRESYPAFLARYLSSRVRDDLDPSFHIFRQKIFIGQGGGDIILSNAFRKRLASAEPAFENLRFDACGSLR